MPIYSNKSGTIIQNVAGTISGSALQVNVGVSSAGSDVLNRLGNTQSSAGSTGTLTLSPSDLKSAWRYDNNSGSTSFGNMQAGAYPLNFYTAGSPRLTISGAGLVGIGVTASTTLEVAGTVSANKVNAIVQVVSSNTGAGTALLGATNCPASTVSNPFKWIRVYDTDGTTPIWIPAWK